MFGSFKYNNLAETVIDNKEAQLEEIQTFISNMAADLTVSITNTHPNRLFRELGDQILIVPHQQNISGLESELLERKPYIVSVKVDKDEFTRVFDSFNKTRQTISSYTIPAFISCSTQNKDISNEKEKTAKREEVYRVLSMLSSTLCNQYNSYSTVVNNKTYKSDLYFNSLVSIDTEVIESNKSYYTSALGKINFEIYY